MPTIRIDQEVWHALQKYAVPLEDTPNDVLRRLLRLEGGGRRKLQPRAVGRDHRTAYRRAILQALVDMGGGGQVNKVLERIEELVRSKLNSADYQQVAGGEPRWRNAVRWERHNMVNEGLLKVDSPRGYWEIADKGRRDLR